MSDVDKIFENIFPISREFADRIGAFYTDTVDPCIRITFYQNGIIVISAGVAACDGQICSFEERVRLTGDDLKKEENNELCRQGL